MTSSVSMRPSTGPRILRSLGIQTRSSTYDLGATSHRPLIAQLEAHGMTELGEHQNITPAISRRILEAAL